MTREASQHRSLGAPETLPHRAFGPVPMVRTQKSGIKYEKPTVHVSYRRCAIAALLRPRALTLNRGIASSSTWRSRGRTRMFMQGVGGSPFPGRLMRADRPFSHSQIFFPQLNVFSAPPRWKQSCAFDRELLRRMGDRQRIGNEGQSAVQVSSDLLAGKVPS